MSQFGRGTFKQELLEEIVERKEQHGLNMWEVVQDSLQVISHLASHDASTDAIYEKAKKAAKEELLNQLR